MNLKSYIKEYGILMTVLTGSTRLVRKFNNRRLSDRLDNIKHKVVTNWLYSHYKDTITDTAFKNNVSVKVEYTKIFVFWWQGEESNSTPPIVKSCIKSIRENGASFGEIVVLDKSNYKQYVRIPHYIEEKVECGIIGLAHFSDILRFNLLNQHESSLWIDATCFLFSKLPEKIKDYSFYSLKGAFEKGLKWRWTSFFMYAQKGDLLVDNMCRFYDAYWKEHNNIVTYLVLDCWITALCKHLPRIEQEIEQLPKDGKKIFNLIAHLDNIYSNEVFNQITSETFVYKLTYKQNWPKCKDGKDTIYGHLIKS